MSFAKPDWLLLLVALPIIAFTAWLAWRRRGRRWQKLIAPRLQGRLSLTRSPRIHFAALGLGLIGLAGLIIAFSQPESGEEWIEVESEGRNILFCIDVSRSMLAEDMQPNRLQASRAAALEILERFPNDRVGVLLFAGEILVQSPLTLDHSFVEQTLAQLTPDDIPYGGSNLSGAITAGMNLLTATGQQSNIMVVFSDGEESTEGVQAAASDAAEEGIFIYALGMGTKEGSFIPDPQRSDGKFRDRRGNPVFTQLDEPALETLARETDGYYSQGMGSSFLSRLDSALKEMDRFREEGKHQRVAKPAYKWFLLGGLFLLMISVFIRALPLRPVAAAAALVLFLPRAEGGLISDGREALAQGEPMEAHLSFREAAKETSGERAAQLHLAAGSAAYRAKSWNAAADSFSEALESDNLDLQHQAHYALANTLFYLGTPLEGEERTKAWQGALEHFQAALKIEPDDEKAAGNLATVQELLLRQEEAQEQEKEKEESQEQEEPKEEEKNEEQESGEQEQGEENEQSNEQEQPKEPEQPEPESGDQPPEPGNSGEENEPQENEGEKEPGEDGQKNQEEQGDQENEESGQNQPQPNETPEDQKESEGEAQSAPPEEAPDNESREERARRLLKQYADFGAKAPRRIRRPYNRPAQDW